MKNEILKLLMFQVMSDSKDEFMNEFREIVREVIKSEGAILDRQAIQMNNRLTYEEISTEYKVSQPTLKKLKKNGLLIPICKGGKSLIFDRIQVEQCLRDRPRIIPNFLKSTGS